MGRRARWGLERRDEGRRPAVAALVREALDPAVALDQEAWEALEAMAAHQLARGLDMRIDRRGPAAPG